MVSFAERIDVQLAELPTELGELPSTEFLFTKEQDEMIE